MAKTLDRFDDLIWRIGLDPLGAVFQLPIAVSVATVLDVPWVKAGAKRAFGIAVEGLAVVEEAQERLAVTQEHIEDRWAEIEQMVAAKVTRHRGKTCNGGGERSVISMMLIETAAEFNGWAKDVTGNEVDLGFLIPFAFGAIAIRQLIEQGLRLKEIPWYVPAWYAFDTFLKLNYPEHELLGLNETPPPSKGLETP